MTDKETNKGCCDNCFTWGKTYVDAGPCKRPSCPCHLPPTEKGEETHTDIEGVVREFKEVWQGKMPTDMMLVEISRPEWENLITGQQDWLTSTLTALVERARADGKRERDAELRERVEGIRRDFIARCEHPDTTADSTLVEETVYHIDHVLSLLTPNGNQGGEKHLNAKDEDIY